MSSTATAQQQFDALIASTELVAGAGMGVAATAPEYRFDAERTIGSLAKSLAAIHQCSIEQQTQQLEPVLGLVPQQHCYLTPELLVKRAHLLGADTVSGPNELSAAYRHVSRDRLLQILHQGAAALVLPVKELVLIQGNPRLSNLRFLGQELLGFEDWSQAALGDPYFDLALASTDLLGNFGPQPIQSFFGIYGLERPDPLRLDWYLLAVELCTQR